ncbi:GldG family protein [Sphingomicrobium astaxanthinifaciens]|uniref:GldG family protein n=1 Tax=Sphingomicrobium astaxanthinifaciens TaxID=1227949 RepID=UPI001FCBDF1D|nr:GldG family protein [Sphingomicrobium astaxanthinifaciens]MCJ7421629.1 GldG family protein [Sphingomicrobium astaxanthinifaciens]
MSDEAGKAPSRWWLLVPVLGGMLLLVQLASYLLDKVQDPVAEGPRVMAFDEGPAAAGARARPRLMLVTSLPAGFTGGFDLEAGFGSPLLASLEQAYAVELAEYVDPGKLGEHERLLLAHPRAQPAEALVALDDWVRGGGRVLLLADPLLSARADHPLGDPGAPAPGFADTGLLARWGVRLDGPVTGGEAALMVEGVPVLLRSPGRMAVTGSGCATFAEAFAADCRIGAGRAIIAADADFLLVEGEAGADNRAALLALLARLAG